MTVPNSGQDISKKSEFRDQVEAMLTGKYGRPVRTKDNIVLKTHDFQINENATVSMTPGGNYIKLEYLDIRLSKLAVNEKTAKVQSGFTNNDKIKF